MPSGTHQLTLDLPIEHIWDFVKEIDHWAPLIPGYITHEVLNDKQSTWEFKGDIGIMKKKIKLKVDIKEWIEPTKVTFKLTGINDNFTGDGFFEANVINETQSTMAGYLNIEAHGPMSKVVNSVLKSSIPKTATELTDNIKATLVNSGSRI